MMDPNSRYSSTPLSNYLLEQTGEPLLAEPLSNTHGDVDLSLVKEELPDVVEDDQETYAAFMGHTSATHNDVMASGYNQQSEIASTAKGGAKRPGKRGRKPMLVATGKNGVKLEKRREQNRRAAATYRKKMNGKKYTIEQDHARLEVENRRQQREVDELRKQKADLEAVLAAHKMADCNIANNNNVIRMPTDMSVCSLPTNNFLNNDMLLNSAVTFANPMQQSMQRLQATRDQSLAPSPYTPKTDQMFTFDGNWCEQPKANSPPIGRSFSPASSQLSASPAPEQTGYCGQSQSLPVALPSIASVYNNAQSTLAYSLDFDPTYSQVVDEFLVENNAFFTS